MDCRGVVEVIAEKVDDEKAKETAAEKQQQQETGSAVDRPGRPPAVSELRSTGPVDRRAQHAQGQRAVDRPVDRID